MLGTGGRERIILSGLFSLKELLLKRETNGPELTNVLKVREQCASRMLWRHRGAPRFTELLEKVSMNRHQSTREREIDLSSGLLPPHPEGCGLGNPACAWSQWKGPEVDTALNWATQTPTSCHNCEVGAHRLGETQWAPELPGLLGLGLAGRCG